MAANPARKSDDRDWAAQTADTIDGLIRTVRSKTTVPIERLVRIVVYGIICAVLGTFAFVLLIIATIRALNTAVPGGVWVADLIVGGIFLVGGLLLWRRRTAGPAL